MLHARPPSPLLVREVRQSRIRGASTIAAVGIAAQLSDPHSLDLVPYATLHQWVGDNHWILAAAAWIVVAEALLIYRLPRYVILGMPIAIAWWAFLAAAIGIEEPLVPGWVFAAALAVTLGWKHTSFAKPWSEWQQRYDRH